MESKQKQPLSDPRVLRHRRIYSFLIAGLMLNLLLTSPRLLFALGPLEDQLCSLYATDFLKTSERRYYSSSGDDILDSQLVGEARRLSREFKVQPALKFIEELNALAEPGKLIIKDTHGTVSLGLALISDELAKNRRGWGGLVIAGILAHEFAHIYQAYHGYRSKLLKDSDTVEPLELHADFLAGYHLGLKRIEGQNMDIGAFMDSAFTLGDYQTRERGHHGTPKERNRAVREGYKAGIKGMTVDEAAVLGQKEIEKIMKSDLGL